MTAAAGCRRTEIPLSDHRKLPLGRTEIVFSSKVGSTPAHRVRGTRTHVAGSHGAPAPPHAARGARGLARAHTLSLLAAAAIVTAGFLAYANSLHGAFVLDDLPSIVNNGSLRSLWPPQAAMFAPKDTTIAGRPIASYSLAINTVLARAGSRPGSGLDPFGFHVANLGIHLAAALILFGVIRRTLLLERFRSRFDDSATALAGVAAILWVVHPLNVVSVSYIVQRVESLMGMFYLLTLYLAIRSFASARPAAWALLAIAACACGMATKEVMVTAPIIVLLYDWIFVSGSLRGCLRRRLLYAGLASSWVILALLVASHPRSASVGFALPGLSIVGYLKFQAIAVMTYLRLTFVPAPLIFDYGEGPVPRFWSHAPAAAGVLVMLAWAGYALAKRRAVGFCLASFFLILAPSSSVLPIVTERISYHRMYLPLAAVLTLAVMATYRAGVWMVARLPGSSQTRGRLGTVLGFSAAAVAVIGLGAATALFNVAFRSSRALWLDVLSKMETNERAHNNYASALLRALDAEPGPIPPTGAGIESAVEKTVREIERHLLRAVELKPDYAGAYINLGNVQVRLGQTDAAIASFNKALELDPGQTAAAYNAGRMLQNRGDAARALEQYEKILRLQPDFRPAIGSLVFLLSTCPDDRIRDGARALEMASTLARISPEQPEVLMLQGFAYAEVGRFDQAARVTRRAIDLVAGLPGAGNAGGDPRPDPRAAGIVSRMRACLEAYERSQPFRAPPSAQSALTVR